MKSWNLDWVLTEPLELGVTTNSAYRLAALVRGFETALQRVVMLVLAAHAADKTLATVPFDLERLATLSFGSTVELLRLLLVKPATVPAVAVTLRRMALEFYGLRMPRSPLFTELGLSGQPFTQALGVLRNAIFHEYTGLYSTAADATRDGSETERAVLAALAPGVACITTHATTLSGQTIAVDDEGRATWVTASSRVALWPWAGGHQGAESYELGWLSGFGEKEAHFVARGASWSNTDARAVLAAFVSVPQRGVALEDVTPWRCAAHARRGGAAATVAADIPGQWFDDALVRFLSGPPRIWWVATPPTSVNQGRAPARAIVASDVSPLAATEHIVVTLDARSARSVPALEQALLERVGVAPNDRGLAGLLTALDAHRLEDDYRRLFVIALDGLESADDPFAIARWLEAGARVPLEFRPHWVVSAAEPAFYFCRDRFELEGRLGSVWPTTDTGFPPASLSSLPTWWRWEPGAAGFPTTGSLNPELTALHEATLAELERAGGSMRLTVREFRQHCVRSVRQKPLKGFTPLERLFVEGALDFVRDADTIVIRRAS